VLHRIPSFVLSGVPRYGDRPLEKVNNLGFGWWTHKGSNLGPLPCEGNALPLSYASGIFVDRSNACKIGIEPNEPRRRSQRFTKCGPPVSSCQPKLPGRSGNGLGQANFGGCRSLIPAFGDWPVFSQNAVLLKQIKVIWAVQSPLQKYFRSLPTQITCLSPAVLSHRGAARDRHGRGAGCGGREERIDERAWLADDEVVWS
jgi:hypothetical protein